MNAMGQILCFKQWGGDEDYGAHMRSRHALTWNCTCPQAVRCEWQGGSVALISAELLEVAREGYEPHLKQLSKHVYQVGPFKVRVLGMKCGIGTYYDSYFVMREGWKAKAVWAYRKAAEKFLYFVLHAEARVRRAWGEETRGKFMPFTGKVGKVLRYP